MPRHCVGEHDTSCLGQCVTMAVPVVVLVQLTTAGAGAVGVGGGFHGVVSECINDSLSNACSSGACLLARGYVLHQQRF